MQRHVHKRMRRHMHIINATRIRIQMHMPMRRRAHTYLQHRMQMHMQMLMHAYKDFLSIKPRLSLLAQLRYHLAVIGPASFATFVCSASCVRFSVLPHMFSIGPAYSPLFSLAACATLRPGLSCHLDVRPPLSGFGPASFVTVRPGRMNHFFSARLVCQDCGKKAHVHTATLIAGRMEGATVRVNRIQVTRSPAPEMHDPCDY